MFKKTLIFTVSLLMVFSVCAFAGEGSDTIGACKLQPQLRYGYSTMTWETHSAFAGTMQHRDFDAHAYYLQLNWGIFNNVDIFGLVGGRSVRMVGKDPAYCARTDYEPMLLWGLGVRATFFRADNGFYVGGGALFTHSLTDDFQVRIYNPAGVLTNVWETTYRVYTLTPEIHVGWNIKNIGLTPYIGGDYTWARAVDEYTGGGDIEYHPDHPFGMFAGIDYYFNDKLYVNVEGRTNFIDGWGVESGIGYKFDICGAPAPEPIPAPAPVIEPKLEPMSKN
jgi:hypothetical protein